MYPPEPSWLEAFKESPLPMAAALLLAAMAMVVVIIALVLRSRAAMVTSVAGLLLVLACVGAGVGGTILGRIRTDAAVASPGLSITDRERITEYGYAESAVSLKFSLVAAGAPLLIGAAALFRALASRRQASAPTG